MSNTLFCKLTPFRKEHLLLCAEHYVLIEYNIILHKIKYLVVFHDIKFVRNFPSPRERVEFQVELCET